ncbi:MAG: divalent metal cation transporter FieF [Thiotrichales bacterium]|nr:MAG: divalent metal cation transporter FieF [Thiotrichales bacterium]PCI12329.1 MAG: divalent metal cation transporter FieF [Thiotrichales bacterium]
MSNPINQAESERLLKLATRASVTTAVILIIAKLIAYWQTDSVSILASLVDSLMDAAASIINLLAVAYALAPPDEEHRFGHGKAESLAGMAQATFIAGSGLFLIVEAIQRLINPQPIEAFNIGMGVMIFSIIATLILLSIQRHVIAKTNSTAIRADALHYKTDLFTNAAIIVALLLSQFGWLGIDPLFALAIAAYILYSSWAIGSEAVHDLLDHELPEETRKQIIEIAKRHPEVRGMHDLRTRLSGRTEFIQMHIELDDELPLIDAHEIADQVEDEINRAIPTADVVIHLDPVSAVDLETLPLFKRND